MDGGEKLLLSSVKATEKTAKFESAFDLLTCDWLFCRTHHPLTLSLSLSHTHTLLSVLRFSLFVCRSCCPFRDEGGL